MKMGLELMAIQLSPKRCAEESLVGGIGLFLIKQMGSAAVQVKQETEV